MPLPPVQATRTHAPPLSLEFERLQPFQKLLHAALSAAPKPSPAWPVAADAVLTPAGLARLGGDQDGPVGAATLYSSRGPAMLAEAEVSDALSFTLMHEFDFGTAVFALDDEGKTITGFETMPPEARTRMFEKLVELGLVKSESQAHFDLPENAKGRLGSLSDLDGDQAVSSADFVGVVPVRPETAAQRLSEAARAEGAQVILLGEHHGVGPKDHAAALVESLRQAGQDVVFGVELPDGPAWKEAERVLAEGPLSEEGAARFESALASAFTQLALANGQSVDPEGLRAALAPFTRMVLRANRAGAEVRFIDGEAKNRDAHMAEHVTTTLAGKPEVIFVALVGLEHSLISGQTEPMGTVDELGADRGAPLGRRLEDQLGGTKVLSAAFLPFGQAQDKRYQSWDRVFALGAW